MTSQPFTQPRRTYLIGKARPNAIVGKNRETGEIALIVVGAFLGMMCGLLVPILPLRILTLVGWPLLAFAAVYMPYRRRTFYRWFEINRTYRRTLRRSPPTGPRSPRPVSGSTGGRSRSGRRPASAGSTGCRPRSGPTRSPCCCTSTAGP